MAIVKCKECGYLLSERAHTCPKCGAPTSKRIQKTYPDDSYEAIMECRTRNMNHTVKSLVGIGLFIYILLFILSILLPLAALAVMLWWLHSNYPLTF